MTDDSAVNVPPQQQLILDVDKVKWNGKRIVRLVLTGLPFTIAVIALAIIFSRPSTANSASLMGNRKSTTTTDSEVRSAIQSDMNQDVSPCTDFYEYACGGYVQNHLDTKLFDTPPSTLQQNVNEQLRTLLENDAETSRKLPIVSHKLRTYYKSCVDSKRGYSYDKGLALMRQMVSDLGGFWVTFSSHNNMDSLTDMLIKLHSKYTMNVIFTMLVSPNPYNVSRNEIQVAQPASVRGADTSSLLKKLKKKLKVESDIGDYSENYSDNPVLDRLLPQPSSYITEFQKLANLASPGQRYLLTPDNINDLVNLETSINQLQQKDESDDSYVEVVNVTWLKQNIPSVDWDRYFKAMVVSADASTTAISNSTTIILQGANYLTQLSNLLQDSLNSDSFKQNLHNYLVFQAILSYRDDFLKDYSDKKLQDESTVVDKLSGDDDGVVTKCVTDTVAIFEIPIGIMFVNKNFDALNQTKQKVTLMVEDLLHAYRETITKSTWLDPVTKASALDKLEALKFHIAFEDWMFNDTFVNKRFMDFQVSEDYATNLLAFYRYSFVTSNLQQIGKEDDGLLIGQGEAAVNAENDMTSNTMYILAAFLTDPVYRNVPGVPEALNYGALGSIIGHEITHSFDTTGRTMDKFGNKKNWWLNSTTLAGYEQRTTCFLDQFNNYYTHGYQVDGLNTLSENIADSTGLRVAYKAFERNIAKDNSTTSLHGLSLSQQQLFFIGFAQWQCIAYATDAVVQAIIKVDVHAPQDWRVKGTLSNSDDFAQAFSCPKNTNACVLW